jgi:hypothetical protein
MPKQPLDAFQFGQQTFTCRIVMQRDAAGILAQHRDAHGDVEPIEHVFGHRRNKLRQSADLLSPVSQEGHILVCLQALTFEQIEQTAFGFGIISRGALGSLGSSAQDSARSPSVPPPSVPPIPEILMLP